MKPNEAQASRAKKNKKKPTFTGLRIRELNRLYSTRYGYTMPDDDAARDDIYVMVTHLIHDGALIGKRIHNWIELRAPWMTLPEIDALIKRAAENPVKWTADKLADRLGLTAAQRRRLGICTIGAIDQSAAQRKEARKLRARQRERERRRARNVKPRAEYLAANSVSRAKPGSLRVAAALRGIAARKG